MLYQWTVLGHDHSFSELYTLTFCVSEFILQVLRTSHSIVA